MATSIDNFANKYGKTSGISTNPIDNFSTKFGGGKGTQIWNTQQVTPIPISTPTPGIVQQAQNFLGNIQIPSIPGVGLNLPRPLVGNVFSGLFQSQPTPQLAKPGIIDKAITSIQKTIEENPDGYGWMATAQKFTEDTPFIGLNKNPVSKGIVQGVANTFLGSSQQIQDTFNTRLTQPVTWEGKALDTVGQVIGTAMSYVAGGSVLKGVGLTKAMLPVLFATLGQTSAPPGTTLKERATTLPIDVITGYIFSTIPNIKGFSKEAWKSIGKVSGVAGTAQFGRALLTGKNLKESAKIGAFSAATAGLFYILANAIGLFTEPRITEAKVITTPGEVREVINKAGVGNTAKGKGLLQLATLAENSNKNIQWNTTFTKESLLKELLRGGKIAKTLQTTATLVDIPPKIGEVVPPVGKEVAVVPPEVPVQPPKVIPPVAPPVQPGVQPPAVQPPPMVAVAPPEVKPVAPPVVPPIVKPVAPPVQPKTYQTVLSDGKPVLTGNPPFVKESIAGLNVGDKIIKIGVPGKSGKETSSNRVMEFDKDNPVVYVGTITGLPDLEGKQLAFEYTQDNEKFYILLSEPGVENYMYETDFKRLVAQPYKAVFEKVKEVKLPTGGEKTLTIAPSKAITEEEISAEVMKAGLLPLKQTKISKGKMIYVRPAIGKTELKILLTDPEFNTNPVMTVDENKNLTFKGEKMQFKITTEALQINPERLKVGDKIRVDVAALKKAPGVEQIRVYGIGGDILATAGAETIGTFEKRVGKTEADNLKLFETIKDLAHKYSGLIGEGHIPSRVGGLYDPVTMNLRVNGMNDVAVAAHEFVHSLDTKYHISDRLRETVGETEDGKPIYAPETLAIRKEITDLYEKYYVGGKRTHPLKKRVREGLATLIQKYIEQPTTITQNYPNLVTEFLTENGKYYEPVIKDLINDFEKLVEGYQGLDALDKIGARVTSDNIKYDKESYLNAGDKIRTQLVDDIFPQEVLAQKAGVAMTGQDPSLYLRMYRQLSGIIANNIIGNKGYWRYISGKGFEKTLDFNWKDLLRNLSNDKTLDSFGYYLVARDIHFGYQLLEQYQKDFEYLKQEVEDAGGIEVARQTVEVGEKMSLAEQYEQAKKLYQAQREELRKNGITQQEADEAYLQNKDRFAKDELMFDKLTKEQLKELNEEDVGRLSNEDYEKLANNPGYASLKRQFFDEVIGEEEIPTQLKVGKITISSLIHRRGSARTIINPVASGISNDAEIIKKAYRQIVYNKLNQRIAPEFPGLAQPVKLVRVPQPDGSFHYPQDKDPNIIMGRDNGKRVPVLWDSFTKVTLENLITPANYGLFERILLGVSRKFTKGTTALFPAFALTNWTGDQIIGVANTTNDYIPLASSFNQLTRALLNSNSPQAKYLMEYLILAGQRQTFYGWQDLSPDELSKKILNEKSGLTKVLDIVERGEDILAIPSSYSEIMTRATEYIKSRVAGKPQIVALEEAGRVTAPFHHIGRLGGNFGKVAIKSIPFFNPTLQVLDQLIRTGQVKKGRNRILIILAALTAAAVGTFALMMAVGTDDQKRLYNDLEAEELVNYIWLPHPDGKKLIKIKVQQFGVPGGLINMALSNYLNDASYTTGDFISGVGQILPQQFDPTNLTRALLSWIPPAIKTPILTALNVKDYPKILPLENAYLQSLPVGLRATQSSSAFAKTLGKYLNLSPVKTDYLITGIFGRYTGLITLKPSAYNFFGGVTREEYFTSGRTIQGYYELKTKNDQTYKAIKDKLVDLPQNEKDKVNRLHQKMLIIDKYLAAYRDADIIGDTSKLEYLRNEIVRRLKELRE